MKPEKLLRSTGREGGVAIEVGVATSDVGREGFHRTFEVETPLGDRLVRRGGGVRPLLHPPLRLSIQPPRSELQDGEMNLLVLQNVRYDEAASSRRFNHEQLRSISALKERFSIRAT